MHMETGAPDERRSPGVARSRCSSDAGFVDMSVRTATDRAGERVQASASVARSPGCDQAHTGAAAGLRRSPRAVAIAGDRVHLAAMSPAVALLVSLAVAQPHPPPRALPPALPLSGAGLLVSAGVAGGLGLAAHVWRIGILRRGCGGATHVFPELQVTVTMCIDESLRYLGLSTVAPVFNFAAVGLAAGGGTVRGRFTAWNRARHDRRAKIGPAYMGSGAGLLALGLAMYIGSRVALWRDAFGAATCRDEGELTVDCVRNRWSAWLVLTAAGQSITIAGAGLLAYGVSYSRGARLVRSLARVRVQPAVTPRFVGFTLAGQF